MAAKKSSAINEVLKREKLEKALAADKIEKEKIAIAAVSSAKATEVAKAAISAQVQKSTKTISPLDIALSQYRDDIRYYFLFDPEYTSRVKAIFQENEVMLKRHHIDANKYLDYLRESFERYKKIHGLLPLEPMKPKYFQYIEDSIKELIRMFDQRFGK